MTRSAGGVPPLVAKGRKKGRKHYPAAWGAQPDQMKMRKRVLCVYDGPRRLWKDEMMLDSEFEIRMRLGSSGQLLQAGESVEGDYQERGGAQGGREAWVTDLDVETVKRAEALLDATEEEKGPWVEGTERGGLLM